MTPASGHAGGGQREVSKLGHMPTVNQYLRFRLGAKGGASAWFNFFIKPFGASSFARFWRQWNPVYGYFLFYYSYRPLSRVMPRAPAMMATFVACGFLLHDLPAWAFARRVLPPGATIASPCSVSVRFSATGSIWICRHGRSWPGPPSMSPTWQDVSVPCC